MPVLKDPRRERFAQEIAKGTIQKDAYVAAGYRVSDESSKPAASRLIKKPEVRGRIQELLEESAKAAGITITRVFVELGKLGFANMDDYVKRQGDGTAYVDLSKVDRDQMAAVSEITVDEYQDGRGEDARPVKRVKFKLSDKRAALADIGKHLGMFKEKVEHSGPDGGPIEVRDDMDLARRVAFMLASADSKTK
jgi:phage terminase small subunit